jgi:hypothetical protein
LRSAEVRRHWLDETGTARYDFSHERVIIGTPQICGDFMRVAPAVTLRCDAAAAIFHSGYGSAHACREWLRGLNGGQ